MPEPISHMPKRTRRVLKPPKYQQLVAQVLDGQCWSLEPQEIPGFVPYFIKSLRREAKRRALRVRVHRSTGTLFIQAEANEPARS